MDKQAEPRWPDLGLDQRAWEMAKRLAVPGETLGQLIARAQQIKDTLKKEA